MTTALFVVGLASIVAGVALLSIPAAAIVAGAPLIVGAVLIERGRSSDPAVADAAETPSTRNPKE